MLKRISIHNFKCFVDFDLDLPRISLVVGSNGSGKTSLWEVLAGLQDVIVRGADISTAFPTRTLTRWRKDEPVQRFGLTLENDEGTYQYDLEVGHDEKRRIPTIRREELRSGNRTLHKTIDGAITVQHGHSLRKRLAFSRKLSYLSAMEASDANEFLIAFRESVANLWLLAPSPRRIEPTTQAEANWLDRDGANFASWWRGILVERTEVSARLLEALRPAMPGLQGITFERMSSEVRELMLNFRIRGSDYKLSASELSDGQRSLLLLYGFLYGALDRPATVFIDEPETNLAPHEMQPWLSAMRMAIEDHGGQVLVISHHPEVIDYVASAHTIQFRRPHGGPAMTNEVTLETTGGRPVSEWLSRPWAYEDEEEGDQREEEPAP
ncbi:AAA family ATPase [Polyangium mundeleinium]|uniref:AAA family ATPase n=1 Tax=Polyangium mundeleinium TaxID=2995306 RepID=A0ABT5EVU6_9BACT|nr:AAA family ATPase [Polyangium mundeleinium]MDC0745554.1 AAA family ATPase [Polyangium mundeleinium]